MSDKRYAVYSGRNPGVYDSWAEARQQVDGYSGNCHEKVGSSGKAESKPYVVYEGGKPGVYTTRGDRHTSKFQGIRVRSMRGPSRLEMQLTNGAITSAAKEALQLLQRRITIEGSCFACACAGCM